MVNGMVVIGAAYAHMGENPPILVGFFHSDVMGARTLRYHLMTSWVVSSFFCFLPIFWRAVQPSSDPHFGEQVYVATACVFMESRNFKLNIQPHLL